MKRLMLLCGLLAGCSQPHADPYDCPYTPRMSYEQSHAIKQSLIPTGHSMAEYELDHIVPLCMGGTNDRANLQLQTWPDAKRKDVDEAALCRMVQDHTLTCAEAQQTMRDWR